MNPRTKSQDIRDLSQNDIRELVAELGQPAFRAKQLIEWVFEKNVCSFDDMTNLPKAFREQLKEAFAFDTPTELTKQVSKDGSRKYLLEYHDGVSVETVGMPRRNKLSVCVSTQAGCLLRYRSQRPQAFSDRSRDRRPGTSCIQRLWRARHERCLHGPG